MPVDGELLAECSELLSTLKGDLAAIVQKTHDTEILQRAHRAAHTVKGLVGFLGKDEINVVAAGLSEELRKVRDGETVLTPDEAAVIARTVLTLDEHLVALADNGGDAVIRRTARPLDSGARDISPGTAVSGEPASWDLLAALSSNEEVRTLARAVTGVLESLGIEARLEGTDYTRSIQRSASEMTVIIDIHGDLVGAVVMSFDAGSAARIGAAVTTAMVGEAVRADSPEEEKELVEGALGELANRAANKAMQLLSVTGRITAPRFITGVGRPLASRPVAVRAFTASTAYGEFEIGFAPGSALCSELSTEEAEPAAAKAEKKRVVIADDSMVMRKTINRLLAEAGFEVVAQASDGRAVVEEVRRHRPDLVVLDINMPVMGGLDALKIMRAEDPSVRVLICSAVVEEGTIRRGISAGAVGYITKPFDHEKLVQAVEHLVRSAPKTGGQKADESSPLGVSALGPYKVMEPLGEGGMAVVYKGEDLSLGREVALKIIKDEFASNADLVVRFLNEARAVARVNHPNVVNVYYAGSDKGKHFFAMELLRGPDLEELVARDGPMDERRALSFVVQAGCGLAAAAAQNLVHCDVKPSNLVTVAGGLIKVTDFGIARAASDSDVDPEADIAGTPCFMSPEQVLGQAIDLRADIYALGATLYYLLTGVPPYDGDDGVEIALRQVHDPVPQIPTASKAVNKLLSRMMAKNRDGRYATYNELLTQIRSAL